MKARDLVKGTWYFTVGNFYIKFDYSNGNEIWVTEYITSRGNYYNSTGTTHQEIVREANADDYQKYPVMGVFNNEISNYEIF